MNSYLNNFTVFDENISSTKTNKFKTKIRSEIIWVEISVNFFGLTMPLLSFENISAAENNENNPIFVFTINDLTIFCEKNKKKIIHEMSEKIEEINGNFDENFDEIIVCSLILKIKSVNLLFFDDLLSVEYFCQNEKNFDCEIFKKKKMIEILSIKSEIPLFYENDELLVPFELPLFRLLSAQGYEVSQQERKLLQSLKTTVSPHEHGGSSLFSKIMKLTTSNE